MMAPYANGGPGLMAGTCSWPWPHACPMHACPAQEADHAKLRAAGCSAVFEPDSLYVTGGAAWGGAPPGEMQRMC